MTSKFLKYQTNDTTSYFTPKYQEKYKGKYPIVLRSQWERVFAQWCDINPNVLTWSSESLEIPYYDPVKRKDRRYYPDFIINVLDKDRKREVVYVIEIKPYKETVPPKSRATKSTKTKIHEQTAYATNSAKWQAATKYCRKYGFVFRIFTERELFGDKR
jgi:hypothetical protein